MNIILIIYIFAGEDCVLAGKPTQEWNSTFGGLGVDLGYSVLDTGDGGFVIAGANGGTSTARGTFGTGALDAWLIKTDSMGIEEWNRTFGGVEDDFIISIQETDDGYISLGISESYGAGGVDIWLIKTNSIGIEEWNRTFGGEGFECGNSVLVADDGGYIIAGGTASLGAGRSDLWLIKTDPHGFEEWNRTFGGEGNEVAYSVLKATDSGYIILGDTSSYGAGKEDVWLLKVNSSGMEVWNRTYGGVRSDKGRSLQIMKDGGSIIAGDTSSYGAGGRDVWLVKTNSSGQEEWNRSFGGQQDDAAGDVLETRDGGYLVAGWTESYGSGDSDVWLIKTDEYGGEEWMETMGGYGFDEAASILETDDTGYIVCGTTDPDPGSIIFAYRDIWLAKLAPQVEEELNETINDLVSRTRTVGLDGYDYTSIQDAIEAADPGDTIEIHGGVYFENVNVTKRLNLTGIGTPIVDAGGSGNGITLIADRILLKGFEVINSSQSKFWTDGGIVVMSKDNLIEGNKANRNLNGILLADDSSRNLVHGNSVSHNSDSGILVRKSRFNTIRENEAHSNKNGILIEHSSNENRIESNNASDNENGIGLDYSHGNFVYGNSVVNNTYGITIWSSNANLLYGNNMENIEIDAFEGSISNETSDRWDNGTIGNRYGNFDCIDEDDNGICDIEYKIDGNLSIDRFPLATWSWKEVNP